MANKCSVCGKFVSATDSAKCTKCTGVMHRSCATGFDPCKASSWRCQPCKDKGSRKSPTNSLDTASDGLSQDVSVEESVATSLAQEIRLLRREMASVRQEMSSFRLELANVSSSMTEFNKRVDAVEERMTAVEQLVNQRQTSPGETCLMDTITQLKAELNEREQDDLLNDIEISGLPEKTGENPVHLTTLVAKKIGIDISVSDIVSAERRGPRRTEAKDGDQQRPRLIRVRLARRSLRDDMLRAARTRRGADTSGILDGEARRIFINEYLTRTNRLLFYKAREEGRRHNWRYVWTRGGRIYARQDSGSDVNRIRTDADISRIFGGSPVCL